MNQLFLGLNMVLESGWVFVHYTSAKSSIGILRGLGILEATDER